MTNDEKAKAYDMALEAARKELGCDRKEYKVVEQVLKSIFPQLRESEDERIRKWLVDYFSSIKETVWIHKDITCGQILAWLEKQKDASKAIEAVDRIDKYIDEHLANAHDMKDSNPDKKYYRGWDDALGKMAGILQDVYSGEKQKEPKPAWSEEDEKKMLFLERLIEYNVPDGQYGWADGRKGGFVTKSEAISILKSLRPSWKPSEEQMGALQHAIDACESEWAYQDDELRSLLNDIKKL